MAPRHIFGTALTAAALILGVLGTRSLASGPPSASTRRSTSEVTTAPSRSGGNLAATPQGTPPDDAAVGPSGPTDPGPRHYGALSVHVTFESMGLAPGTQIDPPAGVSTTVEGYTFTPGPNNASGLNDSHFGNMVSFWNWNGTTLMQNHDDVVMTKAGGGAFSLVAFDFAGWPVNKEIAFTVTGQPGNVTQQFTPDRLVDGPDGVTDFQTFFLSPDFGNVTSVTWEQSGPGTSQGLFGLDNIVTDLPTATRSDSWGRIKRMFR